MAQENQCPQCGAQMPPDAPEGLCPKCLMKAVKQDNTEVTLNGSAVIEGPGTKIGRYELLELIGEGGMGLVYLAEQKEPVKRRVALKIIKPGMDSAQVIARFEAERQALALLDHHNIAHVFDAGTTETGRPYFVMEYVKGMSITRYCDEHKLDVEQRLRLFREVCEGVHHAHQKGIIHRDIKPSNILISIHEDRAVPKIIDFGIAKAAASILTEKTMFTFHGQLLGTPEYMSPEQVDLETQDIDTRSDIYSLGVVLYELLAGVLPFDRESLHKIGLTELQHTLREVEPAPPSIRLTNLGQQAKAIADKRMTQVVPLARRLHRELEWIPLKAMRKDRCRRYKSASDMADDVQNYLNGNPLLAGPETAMYRVQKFVRKHAGSVTTAALVSVAVIIGLMASLAMASRAEKARQQEAAARVEAEQARDKEAALRAQVEQALARAEKAEKATKEKAEELRSTLYVNSIQLADAKHREGNTRQVRSLLDSCPEDLRGWEWDRLNYIADQSRMTLQGHTNWISSIAISPEGKRVVSASWDNTIRIWDIDKGIELRKISREHGNYVFCIALSPDGRRIVAGDNAGQIDVWDITTGENVMVISGNLSLVSTIAFSPDGKHIISGSWDTTTKIWDAETGATLATLMSYTGGISSITFSPDGKRIASAAYGDDKIRILDGATHEELMTLRGKSISDSFVSFSPDDKWIVSAQDNEIKIWDSTTGAKMMTLNGHEGWIRSVTFSRDGKRIVSGSADNTIKVWDTATGENILTFRGHEGSVSSVAITPDGKQVVSGSADSTIKLWDIGPDPELARFEGHKEKVYSLTFSPDGRQLVSASMDGTLKVWDVVSGTESMSLLPHGFAISSTVLSPDGRLIAYPNYWNNTVKLWDATTGHETRSLHGHEARVLSIAFSPDGRQIASGSYDKTINIWDIATAKEIITLQGHTELIISVAFSPDGKRIASVGTDFRPPRFFGRRAEIKIWDVATGINLINLGYEGIVSNVVFSPDGGKIICGSRAGAIKVWDSGTGAELMTLRGHTDAVISVAFSPDGRRIVSASRDGMAKIWDSTSGSELLTLRNDSGFGLHCVTFSTDGKSIAAGTVPGTIMLWESSKPVGGYHAREVGKAARTIIEELFQKYSYYYEVIDKLEDDKNLDQNIYKIALQIANSRRCHDSDKLRIETLDVVYSPDRNIESYQQALKKIEIANRLESNNPDILTILGMAQYRVGTYHEAIKTLTMAEKMWESMEDPIDASVAYIARAMAAHKLGQDEQTKVALKRLQDLRKEEPIAGIKEAQAFLDEAEKLLSGEKQ